MESKQDAKKNVLADLIILAQLQRWDGRFRNFERLKQEHQSTSEETAAFANMPEGAIDSLKVQITELQLRLEQLQGQGSALKKQLKSQKTSEQYYALEATIEKNAEAISALQLEIKQLQQKVAEEKNTAAAQQASAQEAVARVQQQRAEQKRQLSQFEAEMAEYSEKRHGLIEKLKDPTLLNRYETLSKRLSDPLMPVYRNFCDGCQLTFPPQLFSLVRSLEQVCACPNCHRIFYYHPEGKPDKPWVGGEA